MEGYLLLFFFFFFLQSFVVIHYICVVKFAGLLAYINNDIVVIFALVVVLSHFELPQNLLDSGIVCLWGDGCAVELQSEVLVTVLSNWHGYVPLYLWSLRWCLCCLKLMGWTGLKLARFFFVLLLWYLSCSFWGEK